MGRLPRLDLLPWAEVPRDQAMHRGHPPGASHRAEQVRGVLPGAIQGAEQKEQGLIRPDRIQGVAGRNSCIHGRKTIRSRQCGERRIIWDRRDSGGLGQTRRRKGFRQRRGGKVLAGNSLTVEPNLRQNVLSFLLPWHRKQRGWNRFQVLYLDVSFPPVLELNRAIFLVLLDGTPPRSTQFRDQQPALMVILVAGNPCFLNLGNGLSIKSR